MAAGTLASRMLDTFISKFNVLWIGEGSSAVGYIGSEPAN
jgi:hypothetical protein